MASSFQSSVQQIPDFRSLLPRELDTFIAQYLQPDEQFHSLVSPALDALCRYLEYELRPFVKRIVKSGSLAKGTALKNSSDLDCILIMNTKATNALQLRAYILHILAQIERLFARKPLRQHGWDLTIIKVEVNLLQFEMTKTSSGKSLKVDLLPTFDANVTDGHARLSLYNDMQTLDENTKFYCSVALAELRKKFVIERPAKLKNLIRLVKHWAKTYLPSSTDNRRMPSSYLIELVTIHCWEEVGGQCGFNTAILFMLVMILFCNHNKLDISWNWYYTPTQQTRPRILDPANPYNNVYNDVTDWGIAAQVARQTLQMPAMQVLAFCMLLQHPSEFPLILLAYLFSICF